MSTALVLQDLFNVATCNNREQVRGQIMQFQELLQASPNRLPAECSPVKHLFAPGCYTREITMPAGIAVIGKLHRHAHVNIISQGRVLVATEFGVQELVAPCSFVSQPGTKRVVYVVEDTVWATVHPTNSTDLAEIEREVIAEDYSDLELLGECSPIRGVNSPLQGEQLCLGGM